MAGKPKAMSQIKQLLRLSKQGWKIKPIARTLGLSKNTVKSYLQKVAAAKWSIDDLLALDDPVLEARFHAGNPAYKEQRYEQLKGKLDYYVGQLKLRGVTKELLYDEYAAENPDGYRRSQFCHHLLQHILASKPSMVITHNPGDKLFIDFAGTKLSYVDRQTGELMECEVFVASMPFSDFGFAMAVPSQKKEDFIHALTCCLNHLGGVPNLIVPDNLRSAVTKAWRFEAELNRTLEDFANHYSTAVLPARAAKPKDKALVENQVKLVYNRVYAKIRKQQFFSLAELNQAMAEKMKAHNQTRMQEKPWCREERFLAEEKPRLSPLPEETFEIKHYRSYTVRQNNHIKLQDDNHHYSVPYQYIGQKARVIYTQRMVRIYINGEQVATHRRDLRQGYYSTEKSHLCFEHQHYLSRSPDYYITRALYQSEVMHRLFKLIFAQDRHPEQLYNTCDGLLRMRKSLDAQEVDAAFQIAIDHQHYSYRFIQKILENKMIGVANDASEISGKRLPEHENIRGKDYYSQQTLKL